jgi:hypothetical protein
MIMRTLRHLGHAFAISVIGLVSITASPAFAQAQMTPEMKAQATAIARLCRGDAGRLCPGVQPGGGRILACLQQQAGALSPQCRDALPKR